MSPIVTIDAVAKALVDAVTAACGTRLGGGASVAPSDAPTGQGWTFTLHVSGSVQGRVMVWFDSSSAAAFARAVLQVEEMPADDAVETLIAALTDDAVKAVIAKPEFTGLTFGAPAIGRGIVTPGARVYYVAVPNIASCFVAVGVERAPAAARISDDRVGAVLGVDLPVVVRFGRTRLPLRAIADLGPGSVIDMGRSPDEPVDLLVGERVIAHGDVVVVGGNYGVRITQVVTGRETAASDREERTI